MGIGDLGMHGSGISTPNIDRLAQQNGLYLKNNYVLNACTKSRIALLTGRYPYRMGIYEVIRDRAVPGVPPGEIFLPEILQQVGYRTRMVGKVRTFGN